MTFKTKAISVSKVTHNSQSLKSMCMTKENHVKTSQDKQSFNQHMNPLNRSQSIWLNFYTETFTGVLQVVSNDMKTHTKVLLFTGVTLN